jgi:hypothetical protein
VAAVPGQLEVLAALKGRVDFSHPTFGYVDLENPSNPALGGTPGEPASLRHDIDSSVLPVSPAAPVGGTPASPTPSATPIPAATPTPAPTPRPTPTPFVFNLAPPSASASRQQ